MADYQEQNITGKVWTRCKQIIISNPHTSRGAPSVSFSEEIATDIGPRVQLQDSVVTAPIMAFDPAATIPLCDPTTLVETGTTVTMGEMYVMLFSAYMFAARRRDTMVEEMESARLASLAAILAEQEARVNPKPPADGPTP